MIARAIGSQILPDILRDLKKYTAKAIIQQIEDEPESRKEWLLARFKYNGKYPAITLYLSFICNAITP